MATPEGKLHARSLAARFLVLNSLSSRNLRRNGRNRPESGKAGATL
jgi:hypothetical protein